MHSLRVQNFGSQENSRVQREQPHSQKKLLSRLASLSYHNRVYTKPRTNKEKTKKQRKHKTENDFVQKMLEFTREILNSDDALKNSQYIYIYKPN